MGGLVLSDPHSRTKSNSMLFKKSFQYMRDLSRTGQVSLKPRVLFYSFLGALSQDIIPASVGDETL